MELLAVTYHYVDDPDTYKAGIYPVSPKELENQLDLIKKQYTIVGENDLVSAVRGEKKLPEKSCVITLDDGLLSQYENALPILKKQNVPAIFFIPTMHLEGRAYTLHKIHYLLSRVAPEVLLRDVERVYKNLENEHLDWKKLDVKKIMEWYRYDTETAAKFKFLINHHLPQETVDIITDTLFQNHGDISEKEFCTRFYVSREHIQDISKNPLFSIGLHTHDHLSIAQLPKEDVEKSISKNFSILKDITGITPRGFSYPFGVITKEIFNEKVRDVTKNLSLSHAFSIEKKVNTDLGTPHLLGRFNPNDLPGGKKPLIVFNT